MKVKRKNNIITITDNNFIYKIDVVKNICEKIFEENITDSDSESETESESELESESETESENETTDCDSLDGIF